MGAKKGTLTLMVGGDEATLEDARPALDPMAGLIVHVGGPGMGQVVKLCNNLIYAAQMVATAEATALAMRSGVDMAKLLEVLVHSTGDCTAVRTRLPVPGVIADSPASNGWQPGFMTDLMAKDLDLALSYAARAGVPMTTTATARQALTAASTAGYRARGLLGPGQGRAPAGRRARRGLGRCPGTWRTRLKCSPSRAGPIQAPALILAADHRARGVITIESYAVVSRRAEHRSRILRRHPRQHAAATRPRRTPVRSTTGTARISRSIAPGWQRARSSSTTGSCRPSSRPRPTVGPASST